MIAAALVAVPVAVVAGLVAFWLLGGFAGGGSTGGGSTGPVSVAAPPSMAGADAPCAKLLGTLPHTLAGAASRQVTGSPGRAAAWGDPPIVLRCGVNKPRSLTPTSNLLGIQGVDWVYDSDGDTTVWTTASLAVFVEVRVPARYRYKASTQIINPLAGPLKAALPPAR